MITKLILDGVLKLVQVCKHENKVRTARVFNPRESVPEGLLHEVTPNIFKDKVNNKLFKLTSEGMINLAID